MRIRNLAPRINLVDGSRYAYLGDVYHTISSFPYQNILYGGCYKKHFDIECLK